MNKFTPLPNEFFNLTNPYEFKIIATFFYNFNAFYSNNNIFVTQTELAASSGQKLRTIKKYLPILIEKFPDYFTVKRGKIGEEKQYIWNYNFNMVSQGVVDDAFVKSLNTADLEKWNIFNSIRLDQEHKRLKVFKTFVKDDLEHWRRNIRYAKNEILRLKWENNEVPVKWIWKCLMDDYAYSKLTLPKKALVDQRIYDRLKDEHGLDLDKFLQSVQGVKK